MRPLYLSKPLVLILSWAFVVPLLLSPLFARLRLKETAMATTKIFGVKIKKNPPESKLTELGVTTWPKWEGGPRKIPWTISAKETVYMLEGKAKVTVDGYDNGCFEIEAGDLAVFPKGMSMTWEIIEAVKKHYNLEK